MSKTVQTKEKNNLKKLQKIMEEFRPPFLEEGLVKVHYDKNQKTLNIKIGRRDVTIDNHLNVTGAGTTL